MIRLSATSIENGPDACRRQVTQSAATVVGDKHRTSKMGPMLVGDKHCSRVARRRLKSVAWRRLTKTAVCHTADLSFRCDVTTNLYVLL